VENGLEHFKHKGLLGRMCLSKPTDRVAFFSDVRKELLSDKFLDIEFEQWELEVYRAFSDSLHVAASKIEQSTKYQDEIDDVQSKLEDLYKKVCLKRTCPATTLC
jgi:hypothetical protein